MTKKDIEARATELITHALAQIDSADVMEGGMAYDRGTKIKSVYLGSVFNILPSSKYYTCFAASNVDPCPRCKGMGNVPNKNHDAAKLMEASKKDSQARKEAIDKYGFAFSGNWPKELQDELQRSADLVHHYSELHTCPHCEGLGSREVYEDEIFYDVMREEADRHDCCVESGEGDPCDLFLVKIVEEVDHDM